MLIIVYQSIVLRPRLSYSLVFLVVVCCPRCCPSSSLSFVLVVVRHPPRLRRVESHSSQHNVDCCVLTHCPPSSFVVLSSPLHYSPLLLAPLLSSLVPLNSQSLLHRTHWRLASYHCTIDPSYHQPIVPSIHCVIQSWSLLKMRLNQNEGLVEREGEEEEKLR